MSLTDEQIARLREVAERENVALDELVALAEAEIRGESPEAEEVEEQQDESTGPARPVAERLLIGFLPFIKVSELRKKWLRLEDPFPDEDLSCEAWLKKHGRGSGTAE